MGKTMKVVLRILVITITITLVIMVIRLLNDKRYKDEEKTDGPKYYEDVKNLDLYPKEIEGLSIAYIDEGSVQGFRLSPDEKTHDGLVVCYGGSEGSPNFEQAEILAKEGYETLALFMFGMKNQPQTLSKIPLEGFEDVLDYIDNNFEGEGPLTLLGASKGAEYVLNLASKYDQIDNLILIAPASYNFSGLDFENYGSSWTYEGEEVPYIDIKKGSLSSYLKNIVFPSIFKSPISYRDSYKTAIENDPSKDEKLIPVKDIEANILLIAGKDDYMWPSEDMAKIIAEENPKAKLYSYDGAGHIFSANRILNAGNIRIKVGGTSEANSKAFEESQRQIYEFLEKNHDK